ncbi:MAG: hypothetical protein KDE09_07890 [Anaerolineales bacterium]|nr:hypothetical protein [Anaerolineales bacterium]
MRESGWFVSLSLIATRLRQSIWGRRLAKGGLFLLSLFLFILALWLMKTGARGLAPWLEKRALVNSVANGIGFGWLCAYLMMSGSPVATIALTFLDAGVLSPLYAFAMISGSRLGASFIVLFVGFLYVLRGRDRATSLSMGLLSLTVTGTTYLLAFFVGYYLLEYVALSRIQLGMGLWLVSLLNFIFDPIVTLLARVLPDWLLFLAGLGVMLLSFNLLERCLPQATLRESEVGRVSRLVYRPWMMLLLGAGITLISMSVSVSLAILVPLGNRGFVRRENVIPYIMGANITTFIDTLLAALLLGNPDATAVVWAQMLSIAIVSTLVLLVGYRRYEAAILHFVDQLTEDKRKLAWFMFVILLLPVTLFLI